MSHGFLSRTASLFRGLVGVRLQHAEGRHIEAVYLNAIEQQRTQYDRLKAAVARLAYQKGRLENEVQQQRNDLQVVGAALNKAAQANDDTRALALLEKQREIQQRIAQQESKLQSLTAHTDQAKQTLHALAHAVQQLQEEQAEMLSRKAGAEARQEIARTLQHDSGQSATDDVALSHAREAVLQLEQMVELEVTINQELMPGIPLATLRREALEEENKQALVALKEKLRSANPGS